MKLKITVSRVQLFRFLVVLIVGYLLLEFFLVMRRNAAERKTILEYEMILCNSHSTEKEFKITRRKCPTQGIVTSFVLGDLANNMWQYANVLAISLTLDLEGHVPMCMKDNLEKVFSNLSLPLLADLGHCNVQLSDSGTSIDDWKQTEQSIVIRPTEIYQEIILKCLDVVHSHFIFVDSLSEIAQNILSEARGNAKSVTYIGVHITTTNLSVLERNAGHPNALFLISAMNEFRAQYKDALFIVVASNELFRERLLPIEGVYVVDEDYATNPNVALAVLSKCNHSIIAENGLALWGAILTKGDAIVSFSLNEELNILMQYNKNWNYMLRDGTPSKNKLPDTSL